MILLAGLRSNYYQPYDSANRLSAAATSYPTARGVDLARRSVCVFMVSQSARVFGAPQSGTWSTGNGDGSGGARSMVASINTEYPASQVRSFCSACSARRLDFTDAASVTRSANDAEGPT